MSQIKIDQHIKHLEIPLSILSTLSLVWTSLLTMPIYISLPLIACHKGVLKTKRLLSKFLDSRLQHRKDTNLAK